MPSAAYERSIADQRQHHATSKTFSGSLVVPHMPRLLELFGQLGVTSALDYGCGKGAQYAAQLSIPQGAHALLRGTFEELAHLKVTKFDPCVPLFFDPPKSHERFDAVLVSHVLFWIPLEDLEAWVLPLLFSHARKLLFVVETIGDEKKRILSDRDAHPRGLHAVDWINLLLKFMPAKGGPDVRLVTEYRADDERIYAGEWRL